MPPISPLKELLNTQALLRGLQEPFFEKLKAKQPLDEKEELFLIKCMVLEDRCKLDIINYLKSKK